MFHLFAFNPPPTTKMEEYRRYLISRIDEARVLPRREVSIDSWTPCLNQCHKPYFAFEQLLIETFNAAQFDCRP